MVLIPRQQKARYFRNGLLRIRSLAMSYSHMGTPTLPSAQLRFTSEFGKGSGGTTALLSLNKKGTILESFAQEQ
jgi:hypothetical protein